MDTSGIALLLQRIRKDKTGQVAQVTINAIRDMNAAL
jgi:ABC-type transporter Mla MlaB component